jgi:putative phosphoribosyl transferase
MDSVFFTDRSDAGCRLAENLKDYTDSGAYVMAISPGGVIVGHEIARILHARFDIIVARIIPIPWNPEAGLGAVTADGATVINETMVCELELESGEVKKAVEDLRLEAEEETRAYRGERPPPDLAGHPVILVSDGLSSGYTMLASIVSVKRCEPTEVVVAVPVASSGAMRLLSRDADRMFALVVSERLPFSIKSFYLRWHDLNDDDARDYMRGSNL